jgi:hypothetical protein
MSEDYLEQGFYGVSGAIDISGTGVSDHAIWRIEDQNVSITGSEAISCSLQTKIYDMDTPVEWKRLYFWSADVQSKNPIKAIVYPVAIPEIDPTATWDELSKDYDTEISFYTWDALSRDSLGDSVYGTWDKIKNAAGSIGTVVTVPDYSKPLRTEIKLNQALRFRRIYFELYLDCDGTASTSPVQVFSIIPMIGIKSKIAKGAN